LPAFLFGVGHLHHCGGAVGVEATAAIGSADAGIAGKDVRAAILAAQDCPLGEYCQTVNGGRSGAAYQCIRKDAVIEGHIDTIVGTVKRHRLHGGLLRLENFRRRFHRFRHHSHHYHLHHLLQS